MEAFETTSIEGLTAEQLTEARDRVLDQIRWCRQYTLQLIESIDDALWYVKPAGCDTHVAWQVGHLAVSQYGLMLFRQRGRAERDLELMPSWLRKKFGRGTHPGDSAEGMPEPAELLERLSAIHQQALQVASQLPAATLAEPIDLPYAAYPNKLGALLFMPIHESLHAGQIGLLRRLHGLTPLR